MQITLLVVVKPEEVEVKRNVAVSNFSALELLPFQISKREEPVFFYVKSENKTWKDCNLTQVVYVGSDMRTITWQPIILPFAVLPQFLSVWSFLKYYCLLYNIKCVQSCARSDKTVTAAVRSPCTNKSSTHILQQYHANYKFKTPQFHFAPLWMSLWLFSIQ